MKQTCFYFGILFLALSTITSCSSDDDSGTSLSENAQRVLGTWGTGGTTTINPKFTFESNGNVKYYTYPTENQPVLEETGTWNLTGDILVMEFPEDVLIRFKNTITFVSDTEFVFEEIQENGFDTWSAQTYFKTDDPNL